MGCGSSVSTVIEPQESSQVPQKNLPEQEIDEKEAQKTNTPTEISGISKPAKDDQSNIKNIDLDNEPKNYPDLSRHKNILSRVLSHRIYNKLANITTSYGFTVDKAIQPGVDTNVKGCPGCIAGDEESYEIFAPLFDGIIRLCHNGYSKESNHKKDIDFVQDDKDFDNEYVTSCSISIVRNIKGFALPPQSTRAERRAVEDVLVKALETIKGHYYHLNTEIENEPDCVKATKDHPASFWFLAASLGRDWPDGRGVYDLEDGFKYTASINIQDHLKFVTSSESNDITEMLTSALLKLQNIEENLKANGKEFIWNDHVGYITTCPNQLATAITLGAELKLSHLNKDRRFPIVIDYLGLSLSGNDGQSYKFEMKPMLGVSEAEQLQNFKNSINSIVHMEKKLSKKESILSLVDRVQDETLIKPSLGNYVLERKLDAEKNYPDFSKHSNMMSKVLTMDMYERLLNKRTKNGFTIDDIIQPGVIDPGSENEYGCVAGDEESYEVFAEFFRSIMDILHADLPMGEMPEEYLDASLVNVPKSFDKKIIISCCFEAVRNVSGFPLPPLCTRAQRRQIESIVVKALDTMGPPFQGKYTSLSSLSNDELRTPLLFDMPNGSVFQSAKMGRDWPDARGAWHTDDKSFFVWINRGDHARFFSIENGGNVKSCFSHFCQGLTHFDRTLKQHGNVVMIDNEFGYLTTEPYILGTAIRCTVRVKVPFLLQLPGVLEAFAKSKLLDFSTAHDGETLELSNTLCFGLSETTIVQNILNSIHLLAMLEDKFANDHITFEKAKHSKVSDWLAFITDKMFPSEEA